MEFKTVARGQLYHQQYRYSLLIKLYHSCTLRNIDRDKVLDSIRQRNMWVARHSQSTQITQGVQNVLIRAADYFKNVPHPHKRMVSTHQMWVYTNHPRDFEDFESVIPQATIKKCMQVDVSLPPESVVLKEVNHKYRTFFKERWLSDGELINLRAYFKHRPEQFRLSPGFSQFVLGKRNYLMSNFFVDHNEPGADFLINLAVPKVVRKTLPIVARD